MTVCSFNFRNICYKFSEETLESLTEQQRNEMPTLQLLKLIAPCVPNPEDFGVQLGYKRRQVISKFLQDATESRETQTVNILEAWLRRQKNKPTVGSLIQALQGAGIPEQAYKSVILDFLSKRDRGKQETNFKSDRGKGQKEKNLFQRVWSKLKK